MNGLSREFIALEQNSLNRTSDQHIEVRVNLTRKRGKGYIL